jgi:lipopolysaccharide export system protein LptA
VLHSAVKVNGLERGRPVLLTASRAELDRQHERALLTQAKYVAVGDKGGAGETAQARDVVVHLRPDGTVERVEAEGEVKLTNGLGSSMEAPRGEMTLSAQSQPHSAVMLGGVKYTADEPLRQGKGEAAEVRTAFDKAGHPEHVVMTGAVHFKERIRTDATSEAWGERELNAGQMDVALSSDKAGKTLLRDAKATGNAQLKVMNPAVKSGGATSSALAGNVLTAHFVRVGDADHLAEVHGDGHTSMHRVDAKGVVETSSGDSLVAYFRPAIAGAARGSDAGKGQGADEISSATEQGHVVMTELPVKKPGDSAAPIEERVTAERAVYDGELERTTLTGNVQVSDGTSVLWADRVVSEHKTGDATANGSVKASFSQAGSAQEPAHVLAARAELKHDSQVAIFYGVAGKPARLWQGASQVDAPVIEFEQKHKRLLAHGEGPGAPGAVHTVLVSGGSSAKPEAAKAGKQVGGGRTSILRVVSRELVYSDEVRRADFTGGVQVDGADGSMRGERAVVYLQAAKTAVAGGAAGEGFMGGSVERVVASGQIEIQQPGRHASGEQLVYTASDGMFVLTGTAKVLPKVVDDHQGTVTGTSLRFHAGDENVVVSNEGDSGVGQRVRTETRVKNKQ